MPEFSYKARNKNGDSEEGFIEAQTEDSAIDALMDRELIPVKIILKDKQLNLANILSRGTSNVNLTSLMVFTRQFSVMINAGLSLTESLKTLADEEMNPYFKEVIESIAAKVDGGSSLSDSMSEYPNVFSNIYLNMVKVGETSGKLDEVLIKISEQIDRDYQLRAKIKGAMIYPIFILVTLVSVYILLVTFVIPKLIPLLESAGVKLPFLTQVLIVVSNISTQYWWLVFPILIALSIGSAFYIRVGEGKKWWSKVKLKIPIAGKIIHSIYMARFTRTFSTMMSGGVNILDSLEVAGNSIGNIYYKKEIQLIAAEVKNGASLSEAFKKGHYSSKIVKKMMHVGESTGTIDTTIEKLARFYEDEVVNSVENLSKTLEPILIVIMGVGVALVVSSVIMPLYDATRSVGQT